MIENVEKVRIIACFCLCCALSESNLYWRTDLESVALIESHYHYLESKPNPKAMCFHLHNKLCGLCFHVSHHWWSRSQFRVINISWKTLKQSTVDNNSSPHHWALKGLPSVSMALNSNLVFQCRQHSKTNSIFNDWLIEWSTCLVSNQQMIISTLNVKWIIIYSTSRLKNRKLWVTHN